MISKNNLLLTPGPHFWKNQSVSRTMYLVVIALLFPTAAGIYFFGFFALKVIAVSIIVSILTEYAVKKLRKKPFIMDGSAVISGLLLALILPPTVPLWMVATGAVFSIAIVKEAFGGLGFNIFNPALGGRAFMAACFSVKMTTWTEPLGFGSDAVTTATPLSSSFVWAGSKLALYRDMFLGNTGGSLGETSALLLIIGGVLLLVLRVINWRIPVFYIGSVALIMLAMGEDPIFHILAGGLMIGAFFMATDYVTSPITPRGRIVFAIGTGALTVIIRQFGGLPEGVCYSILIMNAITPLIDRYIKIKPYGLVKQAKSEK